MGLMICMGITALATGLVAMARLQGYGTSPIHREYDRKHKQHQEFLKMCVTESLTETKPMSPQGGYGWVGDEIPKFKGEYRL